MGQILKISIYPLWWTQVDTIRTLFMNNSDEILFIIRLL